MQAIRDEPMDLLARALFAHHRGTEGIVVGVHSDDGAEAPVDAALFFRSGRRLRAGDRAAMAAVRGRVLDVGAGAGAIALELQRRGVEVTALERLPLLVRVMRERGIHDVRLGDARALRTRERWDTVLALMNGTAPAGTLDGLPEWLAVLARPLAKHGRILVDSTDLRRGGVSVREDGRYVGELQYQLEYRGRRGAPFPQLFVDRARLGSAARAVGLVAETLWRGRSGEYLVALERRRGLSARAPARG